MDNTVFHDSWHELASRRFLLPPYLQSFTRYWHQELWYLLVDPYTGNSWRVSSAAWLFLQRFDGRMTLEEVWQKSLTEDAENTPGQVEVVGLLAQLSREGMLSGSGARNVESFFATQSKSEKKTKWSRFFNFLFLPIPLWDPDYFLRRLSLLSRLIFSLSGFLLWLTVILAGLLAVFSRYDDLFRSFEGFLSVENLIWLYVCWAVIKFVHEMSHALCCRHFGGEVHTMGIMLLVFVPIPYMDASSAWQIRERGKRALIGAAGMLAEFFMAALAALLWAFTDAGAVHNIAFNIMFIASVSTLVFNINPLLRLDGYYILSDLTDVPNLHQSAFRCLKKLFSRFILGVDCSLSEFSRRELCLLPIFAISSGIYRFMVFSLILFVLSDKFLGLGLVLAALALIFWLFPLLYKVISFFAFDSFTARRRLRSLSVFFLVSGMLFALLFHLPFPAGFSAQGQVKGADENAILTESSGFVQKIHVQSGDFVRQGDIILSLQNADLLFEAQLLTAEIREQELRLSMLVTENQGFRPGLKTGLSALKERRLELKKQLSALQLRANQDGIIFFPDSRKISGGWLPKGTAVARIFRAQEYEFQAVVPQEEMAGLLGQENPQLLVRLHGNAEKTFPAVMKSFQPGNSAKSPEEGSNTLEPYFLVNATIKNSPAQLLKHNQRGIIRFRYPPSPIGYSLIRQLKQLLQRRYRDSDR
jgi:putative peptide zinc metalloprotease protein